MDEDMKFLYECLKDCDQSKKYIILVMVYQKRVLIGTNPTQIRSQLLFVKGVHEVKRSKMISCIAFLI